MLGQELRRLGRSCWSSYRTERICSWGQLLKAYGRLAQTEEQWIFRGQKDSTWPLMTTLERAARRFGIEWKTLSDCEERLLRRFQRQYHQFSATVPDDTSVLEWLALMQHYGAPTRLLDWTYSFWVAVHFALEDANSECAVWALNSDWMRDVVRPRLGDCVWKSFEDDMSMRNPTTWEKVFAPKSPNKRKEVVLAINPHRLNTRLVLQQGIFLCPGDVSKPFECNLATLRSASGFRDNFVKYTIVNDRKVRREILRELHRMNVNEATLFPGLEGFARSLKTLLPFPRILGVPPVPKGQVNCRGRRHT